MRNLLLLCGSLLNNIQLSSPYISRVERSVFKLYLNKIEIMSICGVYYILLYVEFNDG